MNHFHYYYKDIYIENVKCNKAIVPNIFYNLSNTSNYVIQKVTVKNSWLEIKFPLASNTYINMDNSEYYIDNLSEYVASKYLDIGINNGHANKVIVTNSHIRKFAGSITTLIASNLLLEDTSSGLSVTNIYASNLQSRIHFDVIKAATIVNISNMQYNASTQHFNFVKASGTVYYQEINTSSGVFETKTIA